MSTAVEVLRIVGAPSSDEERGRRPLGRWIADDNSLQPVVEHKVLVCALLVAWEFELDRLGRKSANGRYERIDCFSHSAMWNV